MNDSTSVFELSLHQWVALFGWAPSQHHACDPVFGGFPEETRGVLV